MKHEFCTQAPMLRIACAVAALCITLSIGGFIDFLAVGYVAMEDAQPRPTMSAAGPHALAQKASA